MLIKLLFKSKISTNIILLIDLIKNFVIKNFVHFKINYKKNFKYCITLLKSPHVYKTSQEQIGFKINKKSLIFLILKKNHVLYFIKKIKNILFNNIYLNFKLIYNNKIFTINFNKLFNLNYFTFLNNFNINYLKLLDVLGEVNIKNLFK